MNYRRIVSVASLAVAMSACASGSQWREVSPAAGGVTPSSLRFFIKDEVGPNLSRSIYVENLSAKRVRITQLELRLCENITTCGTNRVNVDARAGETVLVRTVRPTNPQGRFSFNYRYDFVVLEPNP